MNNKRAINPKISLSDYARIQKAADSQGITVIQWIENAIQKALMLTIFSAVIYLMLP